ncbi:MAG: hypothetical protein ABR552_05200 [Actinomycetota bacterium]
MNTTMKQQHGYLWAGVGSIAGGILGTFLGAIALLGILRPEGLDAIGVVFVGGAGGALAGIAAGCWGALRIAKQPAAGLTAIAAAALSVGLVAVSSVAMSVCHGECIASPVPAILAAIGGAGVAARALVNWLRAR